MTSNNSDSFINPYTFVTVPSKNPRNKKIETDSKTEIKTGVIDCSIKIESPTFIPNTTKKFPIKIENEKIHYYNEFYSYEDLSNIEESSKPKNPIVPGSEIRGMVRNVYEQLTNSCFLEVDENNLPYKRIPLPKIATILSKDEDGWCLYYKKDSAGVVKDIDLKLVRCNRFNEDKNNGRYTCDTTSYNWGDLIYIKKNSDKVVREFTKAVDKDGFDYSIPYKIHLVPKTFNKKYFRLYRDDDKYLESFETTKVVSDEDIERFKNVLESYANDKVNASGNIKYYQYYEDLFKKIDKENSGSLMVYVNEDFENSEKMYLAPSCLTKEYFVNKISGEKNEANPSILESQNEHNKCESTDELCPACRMFGMIGKNGSVASKVRFCDTYENEGIKFLNQHKDSLISDSFKDGKITLPVLGSPRISATEFYLEKPHKDALMWTYDYWVKAYSYKKKVGDVEKIIPAEKIYSDIRLKGRKVYWIGDFQYKNEEKTNLNCTVRPIIEGVFKFKVYFEDLTEDELKQLVFCLRLNDTGIHRIGKGKPVGMGAVRISVDKIRTRKYVLKDNKISFDDDDNALDEVSTLEEFLIEDENLNGTGYISDEFLVEKDSVKYINTVSQILAYSKFLDKEESKLVSYPKINNEGENYKNKPNNQKDLAICNWFSENRGSIMRPHIKQELRNVEYGDKKLKFTCNKNNSGSINNNKNKKSNNSNNTKSNYNHNDDGNYAIKYSLNETKKKPEKRESNLENSKSKFKESDIKNSIKRYGSGYGKEDDEELLLSFVNSVKEDSKEWTVWSKYIKEARKCLKRQGAIK